MSEWDRVYLKRFMSDDLILGVVVKHKPYYIIWTELKEPLYRIIKYGIFVNLCRDKTKGVDQSG